MDSSEEKQDQIPPPREGNRAAVQTEIILPLRDSIPI